MVSFIERLQSVLAGVILALLIASIVLVPQNRALGDLADDTVVAFQCPDAPGGTGCKDPGKICYNGPTRSTCGTAGNGRCTCL
jgi:hypothetical protein